MRVDFHVHSTASDGTLTPRELVRAATERRFAALALTDHDNCDGVQDFCEAAGERPKTIPGIELSIDPGVGFDRFHLLGLGIDGTHPALRDFLARVLAGRNARNRRIFDNFHRLGIDIRPQPHGEVLARPHFAAWLVENGYAANKAEAFARYLLAESPAETRCYEKRYHPTQEEAFRVIHAAGGICVMAHPKYWRTEWKYNGCDFAAAEKELAALKEKGLDGLEACYQANTPLENTTFTQMADRLRLLKSVGSDFHGDNKPTIHLGMDVSSAFIAPLLERL